MANLNWSGGGEFAPLRKVMVSWVKSYVADLNPRLLRPGFCGGQLRQRQQERKGPPTVGPHENAHQRDEGERQETTQNRPSQEDKDAHK